MRCRSMKLLFVTELLIDVSSFTWIIIDTVTSLAYITVSSRLARKCIWDVYISSPLPYFRHSVQLDCIRRPWVVTVKYEKTMFLNDFACSWLAAISINKLRIWRLQTLSDIWTTCFNVIYTATILCTVCSSTNTPNTCNESNLSQSCFLAILW